MFLCSTVRVHYSLRQHVAIYFNLRSLIYQHFYDLGHSLFCKICILFAAMRQAVKVTVADLSEHCHGHVCDVVVIINLRYMYERTTKFSKLVNKIVKQNLMGKV